MGDSAGGNKGGGSKPHIGEEAKGTFLTALRRGARHEDAARAAGFCRSSFYRLRDRDPDFAALWANAIAHSSGLRYVSPGKGRQLQLRRNRNVRFTEKRQDIFLDHFAGTCNLAEAAEAAGVSEKTVLAHRARDPNFAARFQQALEQGYARLEADILRRRVEAQQRLKAIEPTGEPEPEFERALKLLQRWDRKDGRLGLRVVAHGRQKGMSFEDAMELLDRRLEALGIPIAGAPEEEKPA
jgi:hypothetical protein